MGITWKEKKTNEFVKTRIREICGYEPEGTVMIAIKRKFKYFDHHVCGEGTAKAVIGDMEGRHGRG